METKKNCKYCKLGFQVCLPLPDCMKCIVCSEYIHVKCLEKGAVPGELNGDIFYTFTCKECSPTNEEVFLRDKLSWLETTTLALYNLRSKNIYLSKRGYFHWKDHIVRFIEDHWDILFNKCAKKKLTVTDAVTGTLSRFDTIFFQSGEKVLGEPALWTLKYPKLTPNVVFKIYTIYRKVIQNKQEKNSIINRELLEAVLQKCIQDKSLLVAVDDESPRLSDKDSPVTAQESSTISDAQRESTETVSSSSKLLKSCSIIEDDSFGGPSTSYKPISYPASASKSSTISEHQRESTETVSLSPKLLKSCSIEDDSFGGPSTSYKPLSDPASTSKSATIPERKRRNTEMMSLSPSKLFKSHSNQDNLLGDASASHKQLSDSASASRSSTIPEHKRRSTEIMSSSPSKLIKSSSNEDDLLDRPTSSKPDSPYYLSPDTLSLNSNSYSSTEPKFLNQMYYFNTCMSAVSKARHIELITKLMGGYRRGLIESPYSGIFLKTYIWRDIETFPPWLQWMCQVQLKSNQHIKDYVIPPRASIDYAYVQPEHIPAVNSLCNRFFWLGIDLTESLRYPEFSCVVLYKRLIVAFAFIVPNVSHTEHYLSYIFTRPGWRRVGIAKRMLYFLIKNCVGKDVTLHVSLDNVAYSMYHKFGFKVERIERNFYEKYIRTDKESKDALFCRRERSHSGDI